jgi:hypothetical protein
MQSVVNSAGMMMMMMRMLGCSGSRAKASSPQLRALALLSVVLLLVSHAFVLPVVGRLITSEDEEMMVAERRTLESEVRDLCSHSWS